MKPGIARPPPQIDHLGVRAYVLLDFVLRPDRHYPVTRHGDRFGFGLTCGHGDDLATGENHVGRLGRVLATGQQHHESARRQVPKGGSGVKSVGPHGTFLIESHEFRVGSAE